MNNLLTKQLKALERNLSRQFGLPIEITFRGELEFTYSFEGENQPVVDKIIASLAQANATNVKYEYDAECNHTGVYFTAAAPAHTCNV